MSFKREDETFGLTLPLKSDLLFAAGLSGTIGPDEDFDGDRESPPIFFGLICALSIKGGEYDLRGRIGEIGGFAVP